MPAETPRILILTASYGEGHNTAARSIQEALLQLHPGAEVKIADLYQETNPILNRLIQRAYGYLITRCTWLWNIVFCILEFPGLLERTLFLLSTLQRAMEQLMREFRPDIVVSTYPIYSFLIPRIRKKSADLQIPLVTVVTDSTSINSAWYRCPSDQFVVADEFTAQLLREEGIADSTIHILGFPVSPIFDDLPKSPDGPPWKVLFMPSATPNRALPAIYRLAEIPQLELTVVAGKFQDTYDAVVKAGLTEKIRLLGWTREMPRLMAESHLYIGKAGGATTQEAIAAHTPFIVSHVVPGQEEGNISLIQRSGIGTQATGTATELEQAVRQAFANNAAEWHTWKANVEKLGQGKAATRIAQYLLDQIA